MSNMLLSVLLFLKALQSDAKSTAKTSGFAYKAPDSRHAAFGGVLRDDEGDVVDTAADLDGSSEMPADKLPIDYVVITELSEMFNRAVSLHRCTVREN